jgi:hypothetical protein
MNTNGLAKHYTALTAEERFRMILAATARDDDAEVDRIMQAAKRIHFSVNDTFGYLLGTTEALNWLLIRRLNLALTMRTILFQSAEMDWHRPKRRSKEHSALADRQHNTGCMFAYLLTVHSEAAKSFADEVGASALVNSSTSLIDVMTPDPFLVQSEEIAAHLALPADEMREKFREHGVDGVDLMTAESILSQARGIRDFFVEGWS